MDVDIRECRAGELAGRDARLPIRTKTARRADDRRATRRDEASPLAILAARFPVVRRLVGVHSFAVMARRFIRSEPPGAPIPLRYGENFSRFLRSQGNAASIEYVADIAELEMRATGPATPPISARSTQRSCRRCGQHSSTDCGSRSIRRCS